MDFEEGLIDESVKMLASDESSATGGDLIDRLPVSFIYIKYLKSCQSQVYLVRFLVVLKWVGGLRLILF